MLEQVEIDGKKDKIINFYLQSLGYFDVYKETPGLENFKFTAADMYSLSHNEDSIMTALFESFIDDYLEIEFDPLTGLIKAGVFTPERMISMKMCEAMLRNTNQYYAFSSNQKAKEGYDKMKARVDSIAGAINYYNGLVAFTKDQNIFNKKQEGVEKLNEYSREITILTIQYKDAVSSFES